MRRSSESTIAIWLVCVGIGLLFLARGAFQPYIFPLFEHLGGLSYARIATLLNGYVLAQSVCAPLAGWYTDRTSVRVALATSILFGLCSFLVIANSPGFWVSAVAVFIAGLAFVLGKISLNTILVVHSTPEILRRSVAKRATLLNLGSFFGNSLAYQVTASIGYRAHAFVLGLLYLPLAIGLAARPSPATTAPAKTWGIANLKMLCRNKAFLSDALRRFALVLPYGCWGTIIPKYVIDQYHSNKPVWIVSLTSVCTTIIGAHFLAVYLSAKLYRRGFKWEWWSMTSVLLYCTGLMMLIFARNPVVLPVAIVVFICGEVLMTPCFDETAKKHSGEAGMATCLGLLHLVDGFGRMLGAAFALAMYGWMRNSSYYGLYWPVVVGSFLFVCIVLHIIAHALARNQPATGCHPTGAATTLQQEQAAILADEGVDR
ncbi:MAG TPA: MFS transporter [Candidatus Binatia bacterium]|jgi:MFS family permease|nr:MFS transporter [Candidatus Binatia bacterium]